MCFIPQRCDDWRENAKALMHSNRLGSQWQRPSVRRMVSPSRPVRHLQSRLVPSSFIQALPKAELHLHLEGSVTPETLLELRHRHGKTSTLAEAQSLYQYNDFIGFLMAFKTLTEDLRTPEDYGLITYRLMEQLKSQNVMHAEVYVSVGVCLWRKQDFAAIFEGLERGRTRGERDFGV